MGKSILPHSLLCTLLVLASLGPPSGAGAFGAGSAAVRTPRASRTGDGSSSAATVSVFGARPADARIDAREPGIPEPRLDLSSLFDTASKDTTEARTSWDIAKEIMLWVGVVAVVGFFIIKVFINPNQDDGQGGSGSDGGKPLPKSPRSVLLSFTF